MTEKDSIMEDTPGNRSSYADTSTSSTVYITDIIEEGNRFGVFKAGSFHAISEHPPLTFY